MKKDVAEFVAKCLTCQKVKAEQGKPGGLLLPLEISTWKWEHISMDFIDGLPKSQKGNEAIWVVEDCLTKFHASQEGKDCNLVSSLIRQ